MDKALDIKLAKINADPSCGEFIIADAKDPDMAYGIAAPGRSPEHYSQEGKFRSLEEFRQCIRDVVKQGLVDIMLMSAHTNSILTIQERLFDGSHVTPAARCNDTTDIHFVRNGAYGTQPSLPFRTATLDQLQCGKVECSPSERLLGANLGLYSITFNNDAALDRQTIAAYRDFRIEAERKGFRHFLEVFDPNALASPIDVEHIGAFVNDSIIRTLAGVPETARPVFLKMVYHGPKFTEELVHYDPKLIVGILGGSSGTTYDAFKLLAEAQKYGAKVALFGRKINNAEHQLAFIQMLRRIVDGQVGPEEAVAAYHGVLQALGLKPYRSLQEDMQLTNPTMSYARSGSPKVQVSMAGGARTAAGTIAKPAPATRAVVDGKTWNNGGPDFASMTKEERLAYYRKRVSGGG
ncbi:MAG: hypothetical protein JXQ73_19955 [Phycisphaerae bacterium]|nr:hypothetical protein [Phycisphaerae bacterium]